MTKKVFILAHAQARQLAADFVRSAPDGYAVTISEPNRSIEQNAAQWPILQAFAEQLEWPVNGKMCKLEAAEWKDILTAAFETETVRVAMGLNGGVVMLGKRTREFGKKKFSEWLEFLNATATERGIKVYET